MESHTTPRQCGRPLEEVQEINLSIRTAQMSRILQVPYKYDRAPRSLNDPLSESQIFFFRGKMEGNSEIMRFWRMVVFWKKTNAPAKAERKLSSAFAWCVCFFPTKTYI
jgi:hypothetical protein